MSTSVFSQDCLTQLEELDALESDMGLETEDGMPAYLQPDKESGLDAGLNLPSAPTGHAAVPAGQAGTQASFIFQIENKSRITQNEKLRS
ncbi:SNF7 family protein [Actinidia rufa]|uniref:SNF7 family protein n=1 Tax=Actinidia rufa TaxID=165716 RepID=A0A7J0EDU0_9ERIC|nr:SNF7 family protein [Actinidia rufa]